MEQKPDWSIEELYKRAWAIVKSNKILWVFAAAASTGSISITNLFDFDGNDKNNFRQFFQDDPKRLSSAANSVLGVASESANTASKAAAPVVNDAAKAAGDFLTYLFSAVPVSYFAIIFAEILLLILAGIAISIIYQGWTQGASLDSVHTAIAKGKTAIRDSSERAFKLIKPLLWLLYIPGLVLGIGIFLGIVLLILGIIFADGLLKVLLGILLFVFILAAFYAMIMLTLSLIWAIRIVVEEKLPAVKALEKGYRLARKKGWAMLLLGIVNAVLTLVVIAIPIAIIGFIGYNVFSNNEPIQPFLLPLILAMPVITLAAVIGFSVLIAVVNAFKATVWSLAYLAIKDKYSK